MKILFLVITSKEHMHDEYVQIDRNDLVRKLCVINTWVEDALQENHDVIFFDGDNEVEFYDDVSKTLHLTVSDRYESQDPTEPSRIYNKIQAAFKWVLKHRNFDVVYLCDEDIYVNLPEFMKLEFTHDYVSAGALGGSGFLFSKKAMEIIVNNDNTQHRVADIALLSILKQHADTDFKFGPDLYKNQAWYCPGELAPTIHYVTGKRSYYVHHMLKFFRENGFTNRKIILGGPFDAQKFNNIVTYETKRNRLTQRSYDFVMDHNGWEYHGEYARSHCSVNQMKQFWPYAKNSTKYFVLNPSIILRDYAYDQNVFDEHLQFLIKNCEESLIDKNNLILCEYVGSDEAWRGLKFNLDGWVLNNSIKQSLKLNFELLNECNFYTKQGVSL